MNICQKQYTANVYSNITGFTSAVAISFTVISLLFWWFKIVVNLSFSVFTVVYSQKDNETGQKALNLRAKICAAYQNSRNVLLTTLVIWSKCYSQMKMKFYSINAKNTFWCTIRDLIQVWRYYRHLNYFEGNDFVDEIMWFVR